MSERALAWSAAPRLGDRLDDINRWALVLLVVAVSVSTSATTVLFILSLLLYALSGNWQEKWFVIVASPLVRAAFGLLALMLLACGYGDATVPEALARVNKFDKLLLLPVMIYLFQTRAQREQALRWCGGSLLVILALSYWNTYFNPHADQYTVVPFYEHMTKSAEPAEVFRNHIYNGMTAVCLLFYALMRLVLTSRPRWYWGLVLVIPGWYLAGMSHGRTGWSLLVVLMIYFVCSAAYARNRMACKRLALGVSFIVVLFFSVGSGHLSQLFGKTMTHFSMATQPADQMSAKSKNTSVGERLQFVEVSLLLAQHRPWFGYGTGGFAGHYATAFRRYHDAYYLTIPTDNPHNEFVFWLVERGLLGVIALAYFIAMIGYGAGNDLPYSRFLGRALMWLTAAGALTNSILTDFGSGYWVCYFAALFAADPRRLARSSRQHGD